MLILPDVLYHLKMLSELGREAPATIGPADATIRARMEVVSPEIDFLTQECPLLYTWTRRVRSRNIR